MAHDVGHYKYSGYGHDAADATNQHETASDSTRHQCRHPVSVGAALPRPAAVPLPQNTIGGQHRPCISTPANTVGVGKVAQGHTSSTATNASSTREPFANRDVHAPMQDEVVSIHSATQQSSACAWLQQEACCCMQACIHTHKYVYTMS